MASDAEIAFRVLKMGTIAGAAAFPIKSAINSSDYERRPVSAVGHLGLSLIPAAGIYTLGNYALNNAALDVGEDLLKKGINAAKNIIK